MHLSPWRQFAATLPMDWATTQAKIEPRFWRTSWKGGMYDEVMASVRQLRLDILMMSLAMGGSDGKPDQIFAKFDRVAEFGNVKKDIDETLDSAHDLAIQVLNNEDGSLNGVKVLNTTTGIDTLGDMPALITALDNTCCRIQILKNEDGSLNGVKVQN